MPIRAQAGGEPRCLMDFWAQRCLEEVAEADQQGVPPPGHASDQAMADTVMDFLFASQDASTASLVWTMCLLADHPDVLHKVRTVWRQLLYTTVQWQVWQAVQWRAVRDAECLPYTCLTADMHTAPVAAKPALKPHGAHMLGPLSVCQSTPRRASAAVEGMLADAPKSY